MRLASSGNVNILKYFYWSLGSIVILKYIIFFNQDTMVYGVSRRLLTRRLRVRISLDHVLFILWKKSRTGYLLKKVWINSSSKTKASRRPEIKGRRGHGEEDGSTLDLSEAQIYTIKHLITSSRGGRTEGMLERITLWMMWRRKKERRWFRGKNLIKLLKLSSGECGVKNYWNEYISMWINDAIYKR